MTGNKLKWDLVTFLFFLPTKLFMYHVTAFNVKWEGKGKGYDHGVLLGENNTWKKIKKIVITHTGVLLIHHLMTLGWPQARFTYMSGSCCQCLQLAGVGIAPYIATPFEVMSNVWHERVKQPQSAARRPKPEGVQCFGAQGKQSLRPEV